MSQVGSLVLVNLEGRESFIFRFFPSSIETETQVNWNPQNVTHGTKPLFYSNTEPTRLTFDELWLDNTMTRDSLTPEIAQLLALARPVEGRGTPPVLLVQWGDRRERVVLERVTIQEQFFTPEGNPIRARASLTLIEIQDDSARLRPVETPPAQLAPSV